jgi:multidrug efflux system membrane fusion protein
MRRANSNERALSSGWTPFLAKPTGQFYNMKNLPEFHRNNAAKRPNTTMGIIAKEFTLRRFRAVCGAAAVLAGVGLLSSCSPKAGGAEKEKAAAAVPVRAGLATTRPVAVELTTFGRVQAVSTVSIKAQVTGVLQKVCFKKGDSIKQGAVLFTIDPAPFKAALDQAEANLARDRVLAANAKRDAERETELQKKGYAPDTEVENSRANADALAATVLADEAARENANIQLKYCTIVSPVPGPAVAGLDLVVEGNLVKAGDMILTVINQIDPVEVFFSVPEKDFPLVKKYMTSGGEKLGVRVKPRGQAEAFVTGELTAADNAVDATSGTIRLAATFENKDERLWPGDYVDVTLKLAVQNDAVVAPARAVQVGRTNKYVYVIKPDNTVEVRPVTVRRISTDEVVVEEGLQKDERVVTDGQVRLTAGAKVEIVPETEKKDAAPRAAS